MTPFSFKRAGMNEITRLGMGFLKIFTAVFLLLLFLAVPGGGISIGRG